MAAGRQGARRTGYARPIVVWSGTLASKCAGRIVFNLTQTVVTATYPRTTGQILLAFCLLSWRALSLCRLPVLPLLLLGKQPARCAAEGLHQAEQHRCTQLNFTCHHGTLEWNAATLQYVIAFQMTPEGWPAPTRCAGPAALVLSSCGSAPLATGCCSSRHACQSR